ncbi:hypothetical protein GQ457_06G011430 [Hibiscus cannabinus]
MSIRGEGHVSRGVRPVRLVEPLDDVPVDSSAPVNPPTSDDTYASVDPPTPRGPPIPADLPHVPNSGLATPASAVKVVGTVPETPISRTLISNGVRTFSGSYGGAPAEAEAWLHDTERDLSYNPPQRATRKLVEKTIEVPRFSSIFCHRSHPSEARPVDLSSPRRAEYNPTLGSPVRLPRSSAMLFRVLVF